MAEWCGNLGNLGNVIEQYNCACIPYIELFCSHLIATKIFKCLFSFEKKENYLKHNFVINYE